MVQGQERDLTGFGISQLVGDGDGRIVVVDTDKQTVKAGKRKAVSFDVFVSASEGDAMLDW